jgi:hypothetical protein
LICNAVARACGHGSIALAVLLEGLEVRGGQGRLERSLLENDAVDEVLRSCHVNLGRGEVHFGGLPSALLSLLVEPVPYALDVLDIAFAQVPSCHGKVVLGNGEALDHLLREIFGFKDSSKLHLLERCDAIRLVCVPVQQKKDDRTVALDALDAQGPRSAALALSLFGIGARGKTDKKSFKIGGACALRMHGARA